MDTNYLLKLIGENKINDLFSFLDKENGELSHEIIKDILLLKNRYYSYKRKEIQGVEINEKKRNSIILGLINIIQIIESKELKNDVDDVDDVESSITNSLNEANIKTIQIYNNDEDERQAFWDTLYGKFDFRYKLVASNIRGIIKYSKYDFDEFSSFSGIDKVKLEDIINEKTKPTLDELIRISQISDTGINFFFKENYLSLSALWDKEIVKYTIINLCKKRQYINYIKDISKFYGDVVYELSRELIKFQEFVDGKSIEQINAFSSDTIDEQMVLFFNENKGHFMRQYYKILEQTERLNSRTYEKGYTRSEQLLKSWHMVNGNFLSRIIVESIYHIEIENDKPVITFRFWDELKNKKILGREYSLDDVKLKISE